MGPKLKHPPITLEQCEEALKRIEANEHTKEHKELLHIARAGLKGWRGQQSCSAIWEKKFKEKGV